MTDSTAAVPDPVVVVDPTAVNGQCEQADSQDQQRGEGFKMDQEMKITDSIEDRGRRRKSGLHPGGEPGLLRSLRQKRNEKVDFGSDFPPQGQNKVL